ncbi:unnamed protein product, partial [Rotaria sp. Silwood1]
MQSIEDIAPLE